MFVSGKTRLLVLCWLVSTSFLGCNRNSKPASDESTSKQDSTPASDAASVAQDAKKNGKGSADAKVPMSRADLLAQITKQIAANEIDAAKNGLQKLLIRDPKDFESVVRLANLHAAERDFESAIGLVSGVPEDHPQAGLPALGLSADWCFQAGRFDEAERRYRKILDIDYSMNVARRKLAYLLNRRGQRYEANRLIKQLCIFGDVTQDELHSLIVQADAIYDAPGSPARPGTRPYWPIGPTGEARHLFATKEYAKAAELIRPMIEQGAASAADIALFGRAAVEAQDDELMAVWANHVNSDVKGFPDYWAALGTVYLREADFPKALRALAEAIRLNPTDFTCTRQLFQCLRSMNRTEDAEIWVSRYALMHEILENSNQVAADGQNTETFDKLAASLNKAGRQIEAILWQSVAAVRTKNQQRLQELQEQRNQILSAKTAFPKRDQIWCGMDFSAAPLPEPPTNLALAPEHSQSTDRSEPTKPAPAVFRDVTKDIGLQHQYMVATRPISKRFTMHQSFGGGVAVLDYDADGYPDLYFAQGAADPPNYAASQSDQLYRNLGNGQKAQTKQMLDVSQPSGILEHAYTLGVTAGDWNQDGFVDLAVANIGVNQLLINQGDGSFLAQPLDQTADYELLTTSLAMADLSGDGLPDLVALNYLHDAEMTKLPEVDAEGNVMNSLLPLSFDASLDTLYINGGDGTQRPTSIGDAQTDAATGLGILVTNLDDQKGNEIFVANDVRRNQLWRRGDEQKYVDVGAAMGCAYGSLGTATGAMGIASADWDRTGTLDLHTTNFVGEPNSMYVNRQGLYRDLNVRYKLNQATFAMVGFGCQALDYSNNGWSDLILTNGHVDDLETTGEAFRQPTQLFANLGNQFELVRAAGDSYFEEQHLGRALATLDYNRDGYLDFVVTDLLDQSVLLENNSVPTAENDQAAANWLQLQLVGTVSERDAIGTKVVVHTKGEKWTHWVTAGDGYLCKNESIVHLGLGTQTSITEIEVTWASGQVQRFEASLIPVGHRVLLVEGQRHSFVLDAS